MKKRNKILLIFPIIILSSCEHKTIINTRKILDYKSLLENLNLNDSNLTLKGDNVSINFISISSFNEQVLKNEETIKIGEIFLLNESSSNYLYTSLYSSVEENLSIIGNTLKNYNDYLLNSTIIKFGKDIKLYKHSISKAILSNQLYSFGRVDLFSILYKVNYLEYDNYFFLTHYSIYPNFSNNNLRFVNLTQEIILPLNIYFVDSYPKGEDTPLIYDNILYKGYAFLSNEDEKSFFINYKIQPEALEISKTYDSFLNNISFSFSYINWNLNQGSSYKYSTEISEQITMLHFVLPEGQEFKNPISFKTNLTFGDASMSLNNQKFFTFDYFSKL